MIRGLQVTLVVLLLGVAPARGNAQIMALIDSVIRVLPELPGVISGIPAAFVEAGDVIRCDDRKDQLRSLNAKLNVLITDKVLFASSLDAYIEAPSDEAWQDLQVSAEDLQNGINLLASHAENRAEMFADNRVLSDSYRDLVVSLQGRKLVVVRQFDEPPPDDPQALRASADMLRAETEALEEAADRIAGIIEAPCA